MLGNYVQYFVMFTLSQAYDILSCDFLENAAARASAGLRPASAPGGLRPPGGRGALGQKKFNICPIDIRLNSNTVNLTLPLQNTPFFELLSPHSVLL